MSVEATRRVLRHSRAKGTAKVVLLGIAWHVGPGGSWPAVETLAGYANVTPRNVRVALRALKDSGELEIRVQAGGDPRMDDGRRPNLYEIKVECPGLPECDGTSQHKALSTPLSESTPVEIDTPVGDDRGWLSESTGVPLSETTAETSPETSSESANSSKSASTDRARERCGEYGHTDDAGHCRQCASERLAEVGAPRTSAQARRAV